MLKSLFFCFLALIPLAGYADDKPTPPILEPRISIFSTTVDWEGISGLSLNQYRGKFITDAKLVRDGLVLYYLDSFPCYGEADSVRVWLGPRDKQNGTLRIVCIYPPKTISFAWQNTTRDADQSVTTGTLECPVSGDRELTINLTKCTKGKDWKEYR